MCGRRRGGCARRGIDNCDGIVCFGCILDIGVVRSEGLGVVMIGTVSLLVLALGLLLLVEFALVLLVLADAGCMSFPGGARETAII